VTHPFLLSVFDVHGSKNAITPKKKQKMSEDYGKKELAAVAAFLPWRGSPVFDP